MNASRRRGGWRGRAVLAGGVLMGALLTAGPSPGASRIAVDIKDFTYSPAALTVAVGTTVTWVNHDEESHTVTSATSAFTSAGLSHDETFTRTFERAGTYVYFCALHPHMRATVLVK
jgi:plastocyanin